MKRNTLVALSLAVGALFGTAAQADVITFSGAVTQTTCVPSVNGNGADATVVLPVISAAQLPNVGDTAGTTNFTISLKDCGVTPGLSVSAYFWQPTSNNARVIKETGTGAGWSYELLSNTDNVLTVGTTTTPISNAGAADPSVDISAGSGTLNYKVRYYRDGAITPGTLQGGATYVLYPN